MKTGGELNRRMEGRIEYWGLHGTDPVWEQWGVRVRAWKVGKLEAVAGRMGTRRSEGRGNRRSQDRRRAPLRTEEGGGPGRDREHASHEVSGVCGQRTGNNV